MSRSFYWILLLIILGACVLYYSANTLYKIYNYSRMTATVEPLEANASVEELNADENAVVIFYRFNVGSALYYGKWRAKVIPNTPVSEQELEPFQSKKWTVLYDPAAPAYNSLERHFPMKETISMIILWILFFYFVALKSYVDLTTSRR